MTLSPGTRVRRNQMALDHVRRTLTIAPGEALASWVTHEGVVRETPAHGQKAYVWVQWSGADSAQPIRRDFLEEA